MRTIDERTVAAPCDHVWPLAVSVERWPELLTHYRWVTRREGTPGADGIVEMAAWRPFPIFKWPTWWTSEMRIDARARRIHYRHIAGITKGMAVEWRVEPAAGEQTQVTIVHEWSGPGWPLVGAIAANWVIGPVFIHGIASRTLAGLARAAEQAS